MVQMREMWMFVKVELRVGLSWKRIFKAKTLPCKSSFRVLDKHSLGFPIENGALFIYTYLYLDGYLTKSSQLNHKQPPCRNPLSLDACVNSRHQAAFKSDLSLSAKNKPPAGCLSKVDYWQPACRESKVVILIKFTFQLAKAAAKYRRLPRWRRHCCWMPLQTALW